MPSLSRTSFDRAGHHLTETKGDTSKTDMSSSADEAAPPRSSEGPAGSSFVAPRLYAPGPREQEGLLVPCRQRSGGRHPPTRTESRFAFRRTVASADNRRWSLNGAPWLQLRMEPAPFTDIRHEPSSPTVENATPAEPRDGALWSPVVATGGNHRQIDRTRKPRRQAKSVANGMVRRGSPVRVRKRALQKRRISALFRSEVTCRRSSVQWVWSRLWSFQI
jgi:hypothetical protein